MESVNTSTSSTSRNFSYPNHQKPQPSKLHWSRTVSLPDMNHHPSTHSQPAPLKIPKRRPAKAEPQKPRVHSTNIPNPPKRARRNSTPSPDRDRHWSEKGISLRKVSDSLISSIRSVSGNVRSLSRRLITPPSNQDAVSAVHQASRPPSRNPPSSPQPMFDDSPLIPPRITSIPTSQVPVLVEYITYHIIPTQRRYTSSHSVGVVYLSTSPVDTLEAFSLRARSMAMTRGEDELFLVHPVVDNVILGLWVCWNQGSRYDDVESRVVGEEEFKRVVQLMAVRGWKDRFVMCYH
ncbi:hypothetical protein VTL71DRAFT_10913 [Oculimacula yallundae]|uniref:Uncharacterized protein n=1 Tax=Oculimacula yallundae TaxID=86028 RepID=A0ABR4CUT8_9HELO